MDYSDRAAAARVIDSYLYTREKRLLNSLARRLPADVTPDMLTIIGLVGSAITALALVATHISLHFVWLGVVGLAINWFGDSLDGTVARLRAIERPRYGFYVDHMSDLASQICIVVGLGLSPLMRFDFALLALVGYLTLSVYTFVKLHVSRVLHLSYFGVGPTEARLLLAVGLLMVGATGFVLRIDTAIGRLTPFDAFAALIFATALGGAVTSFIVDRRRLAAIDPFRSSTPAEVVMQPAGGVIDMRHEYSKG